MKTFVSAVPVSSQMWSPGPSSLWQIQCYVASLVSHARRQAASPAQPASSEAEASVKGSTPDRVYPFAQKQTKQGL